MSSAIYIRLYTELQEASIKPDTMQYFNTPSADHSSTVDDACTTLGLMDHHNVTMHDSGLYMGLIMQ